MSWPSIHRSVLVVLGLSLGLIFLGNKMRPPQTKVRGELQVTIPVPLQLISAFGDRYLAANIGVWRALVLDVQKLSEPEKAALAKVQDDAAWLNPGHEDNYYIAAAILPWEGEVDAAQLILSRAIAVRLNDTLPPFLHGFNAIQFYGDHETARRDALIAAERAQDPGERNGYIVLAAQWAEQAADPYLSVRVLKAMAKDTRDRMLRAHLLQRADRMQALGDLQKAAALYAEKFPQPLQSLDQLVAAGLIAKIPEDPVGKGFAVKNHRPILRSKRD